MRVISWYKSRRAFWFRIFGYGLNIIDRSIFPALFCTRNGHRKEIRIGKFGIHILTRSDVSKRSS